jgi:hypothetical protein
MKDFLKRAIAYILDNYDLPRFIRSSAFWFVCAAVLLFLLTTLTSGNGGFSSIIPILFNIAVLSVLAYLVLSAARKTHNRREETKFEDSFDRDRLQSPYNLSEKRYGFPIRLLILPLGMIVAVVCLTIKLSGMVYDSSSFITIFPEDLVTLLSEAALIYIMFIILKHIYGAISSRDRYKTEFFEEEGETGNEK